MTDLATGTEPFALSSPVLAGLVRIVTNPRVFEPASTVAEALDFIAELSQRPNARLVCRGARHWSIFEDLCRATGASGKLAADGYHAALAIEAGCTVVTTDSDFARFPLVRWCHPFAADGV